MQSGRNRAIGESLRSRKGRLISSAATIGLACGSGSHQAAVSQPLHLPRLVEPVAPERQTLRTSLASQAEEDGTRANTVLVKRRRELTSTSELPAPGLVPGERRISPPTECTHKVFRIFLSCQSSRCEEPTAKLTRIKTDGFFAPTVVLA
ncbi:unnamed protein product [Protopolystoma xenopodis]|uniref:Uncharacterized protein n=1 Tax=Protopolystoma xenopodis TaxID=117903 RepID=A0A3S5CFM6_9PLAT|nr:unnamed protein product [Protopolystoma xenopodis]